MVERAAADAKALAAEARLAELERAEAARKQAAEQAASFAAYLTSQGKTPYADDGKWPVR
jgi:capsid protein